VSELHIENGPVVIVQTPTDPGDMGEPRVITADGETIVFVPSFDLWPDDGLRIGSIEHDNSMCQKDGCTCWCQACERHNWRHDLEK